MHLIAFHSFLQFCLVSLIYNLLSFAYPVNVKDVSSTKWPLNFLLLLLTIILKNADDAIEKPWYQDKKRVENVDGEEEITYTMQTENQGHE